MTLVDWKAAVRKRWPSIPLGEFTSFCLPAKWAEPTTISDVAQSLLKAKDYIRRKGPAIHDEMRGSSRARQVQHLGHCINEAARILAAERGITIL